jgi:hypothetical protein
MVRRAGGYPLEKELCRGGAKNVVPSRRLGCSEVEVRCFERRGQVGDMSDDESVMHESSPQGGANNL